jgi:hypothetical protein
LWLGGGGRGDDGRVVGKVEAAMAWWLQWASLVELGGNGDGGGVRLNCSSKRELSEASE